MQNQIQEYNKKLVHEKVDITIVDYVKWINVKFFKMDISFVDDFIDLVGKDECCISQDLLAKYGITKLTGGSGDVRKIIERNEGKEGLDFKLSQLAYSLDYVLHPTFFKKILIRSRNTDKYADYYLFLEKCIFYYNHYEKLKLETKINEINKLKLLELEKGETLDNFVLVKDERKKSFKYATIRGSSKNLRETLHDLNLTEQNVIFRVYCPHAMNLTKRIKELMNDNYVRQKVYALKNKDGKIVQRWLEEEEEDEPAFTEDEEYITTCNRWFKIQGISEKEFVEKIAEINELRFDH